MYQHPRWTVVPLPNHEVSLQFDAHERLRWHYGAQYSRPFFYPLVGPSGHSLIRIGHPGAPNHDHHRGIWFAHNKVLGIDFWSETTTAHIRQKHWLCYEDGDQQALLAVTLGWYDGHDPRELLEQQVVAAVRDAGHGETLLTLQSTLTPTADHLELGQTNFGLLAVRVAKHLSAYFGGGQLTSSQGQVGEEQIFEQPARWVDYSGPAPPGSPVEQEGITYFDHPQNPGHPSHWHVREDGWMGASLCFRGPLELSRTEPLTVRYLLHAHRGLLDPGRAEQVYEQFAKEPLYRVVPSSRKHRQFEIQEDSPP